MSDYTVSGPPPVSMAGTPRYVPPHRFRITALLLVLALFAAACTDADEDASGDPAGDEAAQADDAGSDDGPAADEDDEATARPDGLPVGALDDPASLASSEEGECGFDEPIPLPIEPSCFLISVPENWDDPDPEDQVQLEVAVFPGDDPGADATIYFDGGPGGHTLEVLSFSFSALVAPFLGRGDFIVFDQRGVGESEPALACPEVTEAGRTAQAENPEQEEERELLVTAYDECRDRLVDAGVDLTAYHSIASSNDVEAIRSLLGYEQLDILSISYGTRLAQTFMRMYPDTVRSVVLDSVFPTEADLWSEFVPGAERAFTQLFDGCRASDSCAETYPDFEERYFQLVERLNAEPIDLSVPDLLGGEDIPVRYDGVDLVGLTFGALYDRSRFSVLPGLVDAGLEGDYSAITQLAELALANSGFVSSGMQATVECNEEIPFESREAMEANPPSDPRFAPLIEGDGGLTFFDICEQWPAGEAPAVEDELVESDIPTLVLAGQYDPITPPAGADTVVAGLANSYSLLFPHEGHGIIPTPCGADIVIAFLADPSSEPDSGCIAGSDTPNWVPGIDETAIEFEPFEVSGITAVSGVRPSGWTDAGNGVFARQRTALDPATLVIQPTAGLPVDGLLNLLGTQFGGTFDPEGTATAGDGTWELFRAAVPDDGQTVIAAVQADPGVLILVVDEDATVDALFDELFEPVASAVTPG